MDAIDKLLAIEEIKTLKARYFLALDGKDHDAYAATFGDDGVFDMVRYDINGVEAGTSPPGAAVTGGKAIAEFVLGSLDGIQSSHRAFMPIIEILSADEAKGSWTMEDWLRGPDGIAKLAGFGYYHDRYIRRDGAWRIAHSELVRWT